MNQKLKSECKHFISDHYLQDNPRSYYEKMAADWWNKKPRPRFRIIIEMLVSIASVGDEMRNMKELDLETRRAVANRHDMLVDAIHRYEERWRRHDRQITMENHQRKTQKQRCNTCRGSGKVNCLHCNGVGYRPPKTGPVFIATIPCAFCDATGKLYCIPCNGKGYT